MLDTIDAASSFDIVDVQQNIKSLGEAFKRRKFTFSYPKILPTDPRKLQWFITNFYQHVIEQVDIEHRVDTTKWLEVIEKSTCEELADVGLTCPHAKEIDQAISQYVTRSIKAELKQKLDDKLKELSREEDISKRWMTGRQNCIG